MKNLFLTLAVILAGTQAHAKSILPSILVYRQVPAENVVVDSSRLKRLVIYADGSLIASVGNTQVNHFKISTSKVALIGSLTEEAKDGQLVKVNILAKCFVASPIETVYSAGFGGGLVLHKGHMCNGNVYENNTDASNQLVKILNDYAKEAFPQQN